METIKNYLDNVFKGLPQTRVILDLKEELLANMKDKYDELKSVGKTENEAIGIVISEFGNIDELLKEMDINITSDINTHSSKPNTPIVSLDEAKDFLSLKQKSAWLISLGVSLILLGTATLIGILYLTEAGILLNTISTNLKDILPVIILLFFIVPAVGLFIFSGSMLERFKFIEEGNFELIPSAISILSEEYSNITSRYTLAKIVGVALCILSPLPVLIFSSIGGPLEELSVCILFIIIALAVSILISATVIPESYKKLLKLDEFSEEKKHANKVIGAVASIVWPIAVAIFLFLGLVFNLWHICWVVFPIVGIVFGGFCTFYSMLNSK